MIKGLGLRFLFFLEKGGGGQVWWKGFREGTNYADQRSDRFLFSLLSACVFIVSDQFAGLGVAGQDRTDNR